MAALALSVVELITKKRDGRALSEGEIHTLLGAIGRGEVPDYQIAALCMAIYFRGMTDEETAALTLATAQSGEMLDLQRDFPTAVEQASTGCVGDYGDLTLLPLLASTGVPIAKVSGPPLGYINSIIGKIWATGAEVYLSRDQMADAIRTRGIVVACHSDNFAPADRALYAIRAVTGTIPSVPLIANSIMGKKIATGASMIHVDVKYGSGAFIKDRAEAVRLAESMANVGAFLGRKMTVPVIELQQPLGRVVGSALEMGQAVAVLQGHGPDDLREHVLNLGAEVLELTGRETNREGALELLASSIASGMALEKFREWIHGQHGVTDFIDNPAAFGRAPVTSVVESPHAGWISRLDADAVGMAAVRLGAGRERRDDPIDYQAGIELHRKIGERVERGEPLVTLHGANPDRVKEAEGRALAAYGWSDEFVAEPVLLHNPVLKRCAAGQPAAA